MKKTIFKNKYITVSIIVTTLLILLGLSGIMDRLY